MHGMTITGKTVAEVVAQLRARHVSVAFYNEPGGRLAAPSCRQTDVQQEYPAPRSSLIDRALPVGRVP